METRAQSNWIDSFFQEAEDLLAEIDEAALALSEGETSETIHRIFRAFHTIKGSSGMCGLTAVADFTHHIETLLDKVRSGAIAATPKLADIVLAGRDQVRAIIAAAQVGEPVPAGSSEKLLERLNSFAGEHTTAAQSEPNHACAPSPEQSNSGETVWEIRFRPHSRLFHCGGNPVLLMRDLSALGTCDVTVHTDAVPPLEEIDPGVCYLWWSATLHTSANQDAIRDVFMFVEDGSELEIKARAAEGTDRAKDAVQDGAQTAAVAQRDHAETAELLLGATACAPKSTEPAGVRTLAKESTVRVPAGRLDRLVNLVGELVMNQSRLTQMMTQIGATEMANPVQELERLVAELRDDVLGIRMLPIGTLFSRFRRMVHDLANELGKEST